MSNDSLYTVIKAPVISEKSMIGMQSNNEYQFLVDHRATRTDVKLAVEKLFGVTVAKVNIVIKHGKAKRTRFGQSKRSDAKKAFVTLMQGQTIAMVGAAE
jgi:large subunit ribosomal protein L23